MSEDLERQNVTFAAALQAIQDVTKSTIIVDMASIHETASDALAEVSSSDLSALRAAGDVMFRGVRDHLRDIRGPILPAYYPHRPAVEVLVAGMVLLTLKMAEEQDLDLGGAMAEIVANSKEAA